MTNEEILKLWKQGYTVEQIVSKSEVAKKHKKNEEVLYWIRHRIENVIFDYEVGKKWIDTMK